MIWIKLLSVLYPISWKQVNSTQVWYCMHIAMLSAEYPPRWGGMGSTVFHLSSALASRGHNVTIITRNGGGKNIPSIPGVEVISVGWLRIPLEFTRSYGRTALRALKKLNKSNPVDVIHLHCPMISWTDKQFRDCKMNIGPIVSSLHGSWSVSYTHLTLPTKRIV